jgi:hypothetical protein
LTQCIQVARIGLPDRFIGLCFRNIIAIEREAIDVNCVLGAVAPQNMIEISLLLGPRGIWLLPRVTGWAGSFWQLRVGNGSIIPLPFVLLVDLEE